MEANSGPTTQIDRWLTLPLDLVVEIDRLVLPARDLGALRPGMILRTRKKSSDPMMLVIGGVPVARVEPTDTAECRRVRVKSVTSEAPCRR